MRAYSRSVSVFVMLTIMVVVSSADAIETGKIRKSPLAGSWYPSDPGELRKMLENYLDRAKLPKIGGKVWAIISPHAGLKWSGQAAAYGFKTIVGRDIDRVVIIGPSHYARYKGICVSHYDFYETPLGLIPVEKDVGTTLLQNKLFVEKSGVEDREHSLEIEIPYLQLLLKEFKIIPLIVGTLDEKDYAEAASAIAPFITEKTLVIASSDFTHYGYRFRYVPFKDNIKANIEKLDKKAVDHILKKDFGGFFKYVEDSDITICGQRPIGVLLKLLSREDEGMLLDYYTSGDLLNDYTSSVSYVSLIFKMPVLEIIKKKRN